MSEIGPNQFYSHPDRFIGRGGQPALHEIHIFVGIVNPPDEMVDRYNSIVDEWNELNSENVHKMKPCYLSLLFRSVDGEQEVRVLQSARYFRSDNTEEVIGQANADADFFRDRGLEVLRVKIEATAYGTNGIPETDEEAESLGRYFEFHIKVEPKSGDWSFDDIKRLSKEFSKEYNVPIPFSYNKNKHKLPGDFEGGQLFLNIRFRTGLDVAKASVKRLTNSINTSSYRVIKVISEYVWYDTMTEMDHGWIDYSDEEWAEIQSMN